jgi:membrane-associated PAP2 superfamily phosphatase
MSIAATAHRSSCALFLILHALLIPGGLALSAWAAHSSGIDERLSALFFDPATNSFPARSSHALELIGHRFAKSAVAALWLTLLAAALAARYIERIARVQSLLWATIAAMALGPTIVVLLKDINAIHCPWDLKGYGGYADFTSTWFVTSGEAGRCFPGGHAAGGFSLITLLFVGTALGNKRLASIGLVAGLAAGSMFSLVRIAQGAHFLSHNLWSAAIDWCAAALAFTPILFGRQVSRSHASSVTRP